MSAVAGDRADVLLAGTPSRAAAVVPGAIGAILFGAAADCLLMGPKASSTLHVVLASVVAVVALAMVPWQLLDARGRTRSRRPR